MKGKEEGRRGGGLGGSCPSPIPTGLHTPDKGPPQVESAALRATADTGVGGYGGGTNFLSSDRILKILVSDGRKSPHELENDLSLCSISGAIYSLESCHCK